ncbi:MAG TPA: hypothetical protein VKZ53_15795 [Candidatus Angelobacter sp.]|nr:hypothetical protein [Candidatus Angelobacter sp.]
MNSDEVCKNAVNWEYGMLITPEHFLRQERYLEARDLWTLRYSTGAFGLVGGGSRLPESEFGAVRHDPIITLTEDEKTLRISVTQCRGITQAGTPVDVAQIQPLHRQFDKADLAGVNEARIYVVANPHEYTAIDGAADQQNPEMQTERIPVYRVELQTTGDSAQHALAITRIRRAPYGVTYEKDASFIPPCTTLVSFSELTAAWREILDELTGLADRLIELYRAMQEYIVLAQGRGIDTELDRESWEFVKKMVPAIEECLYDSMDPLQTPAQFFGHLRKFIHGAAINLDLNPPVQQYFDALRTAGETAFVPLIEQQKQLLRKSRRWLVDDDLRVEIQSTLASLRTLRTLERALEGKYIDFRLSPTLDAMNFIFDRGGSALYKLAAKPARLQGFGDEMTFYFAHLRLEGREKYRLVVSTGPDKELPVGTHLPIEVRINEGAGGRRAPVNGAASVKFAGQRNFEFDFDAPDVPTVTDLRVSVPAHFALEMATLFVRHRFYAPEADKAPMEVRAAAAAEISTHAGGFSEQRYSAPQPPPTAPIVSVVQPPSSGSPASPGLARSADAVAPWEKRPELTPRPTTTPTTTPAITKDEPPPPRRRRLE